MRPPRLNPVDPRLTPQRFVGGARAQFPFSPHFRPPADYALSGGPGMKSPMRLPPHGMFTGGPMGVPHRPPTAGVPFHYTPPYPALNSAPLSLPLTPPGFNFHLVGPPRMNVSPANPAGTYYFHPHTASQTPPLLNSPGGPFAPQGPNIPPDPTDLFLSQWSSSVTAHYQDRQKTIPEDRTMKASQPLERDCVYILCRCLVSLVPRPITDTEKRPGIDCLRMHENHHDSGGIRFLCVLSG